MLVGIKKTVFAPMATDTSTATTYGAVTETPEPIDISAAPSGGDDNILYAGDDEADRISPDPTGDITVELKDLPLWLQRSILGHTLDANGVTVKAASDSRPYFAFGIKGTKRDGTYRYIWYLKCIAKPITETLHTKEGGTITRQTGKVTISYLKRKSDGKWQFTAEDNVDGFVGGATFLDTVYASTAAATTTLHTLTWGLTAPVKAATPGATMNGTGYTSVVTWTPTATTFAASTVYSATVVITAASGYAFCPAFGKDTIASLPTGAVVTRTDDKTIVVTVTYAATGA